MSNLDILEYEADSTLPEALLAAGFTEQAERAERASQLRMKAQRLLRKADLALKDLEGAGE